MPVLATSYDWLRRCPIKRAPKLQGQLSDCHHQLVVAASARFWRRAAVHNGTLERRACLTHLARQLELASQTTSYTRRGAEG